MSSSKPRKPVERFLSFIPLAGGRSALILHVGKLTQGYWLSEVGSAIGGRGFELEKVPTREGEKETYHIHVSADGAATCDCPGGTYHGHCKHADAVRKLIERGTLPPAGAGALALPVAA